MLVAAVGETWIGATLSYGVPIQAYESVHLLVTWFTAVHLWLAVIIGILLGGRILRGRLAGHEFVVEVSWLVVVLYCGRQHSPVAVRHIFDIGSGKLPARWRSRDEHLG